MTHNGSNGAVRPPVGADEFLALARTLLSRSDLPLAADVVDVVQQAVRLLRESRPDHDIDLCTGFVAGRGMTITHDVFLARAMTLLSRSGSDALPPSARAFIEAAVRVCRTTPAY